MSLKEDLLDLYKKCYLSRDPWYSATENKEYAEWMDRRVLIEESLGIVDRFVVRYEFGIWMRKQNESP